jgi:hypothetical protein
MDHDSGSEASGDPAAMAFDALRREVALLNVALSGFAAERASAPDYSEALGDIAQGVRVALGRIGQLAASPVLALTPAEMARQIMVAGEAARREDHAALQQAQERLQRATSDLRGWIDTARLADLQNLRLVQSAVAGLALGAMLGASLPTLVAQAAPPQWAWPEKRAARVLRRDVASAGERLLTVADPHRWQAMQRARSIVDLNRVTIARCARTADKTHKPSRCVIVLKPAPPP